MTGFTPGELLALYAILTTSRAPKDQPADDPWAQNATAGTNYSDTPPF